MTMSRKKIDRSQVTSTVNISWKQQETHKKLPSTWRSQELSLSEQIIDQKNPNEPTTCKGSPSAIYTPLPLTSYCHAQPIITKMRTTHQSLPRLSLGCLFASFPRVRELYGWLLISINTSHPNFHLFLKARYCCSTQSSVQRSHGHAFPKYQDLILFLGQ